MPTFRIFFAVSLLAFARTAPAQNLEFQRLFPPVVQNGQSLPLAWTGGFNTPQFSPADLNNDGIQDLVVFDRAGNKVLTFINGGAPGVSDYTYAPQYACNFPPLTEYALLRDYNQDGAADIFCASVAPGTQEVQVFRGYFDADNMLKFNPFVFSYPQCPICNPLLIYYPDVDQPGFWNNLTVSKADLPAIDDIDGDGDLDIATFEASVGGHMTWFKNISVEMGYGLDSLHFRLVDRCWGDFYESGLLACSNKLSPNATDCAQPFTAPGAVDERENRHPGSTVMTYDQDGDGDKEVVLGDISFSCLNMMTNGGTPQNAWMVAQDTAFPIYSEPVNIAIFPAAFYLDLDNDGINDFVAAPNNNSIGEDQRCAWFYRNEGSNTNHNFQLVTQKFLTAGMIDLGTVSHPALADVNADGLLDLVVGNYGYYTFASPTNASLYLFLNTGSFNEPAFTLVDADWLGMSEFAPNDFDFAPTFGDLDADGDLDLLVGSNLGALYCYYNEAGPGSPMQLARDTDPMWLSMDVGLASTPVIGDIDGDNLPDIVMGERNGNINLFKNNGVVGQPLFAGQPTLTKLGDIDTRLPGEIIGFSAPTLIPLPDGGYQLLTGAFGGQLELYDAVTASATPFPLLAATWGNLDEGSRSAPAVGDLDGDGKLELVTGNLRGGLSLYKTELVDCTSTSVSAGPDARGAAPLHIRPNPARAWAQVHTGAAGPAAWRAYNTLGQVVAQGQSPNGLFEINTGAWAPGVYWVEAVFEGKRGVGKMVVGF